MRFLLASILVVGAVWALAPAPRVAAATVTAAGVVCQGPWAVAPFPTTVEGETVGYVRRAVRMFEEDPQGTVNRIVGIAGDDYLPGSAIWGLPRRTLGLILEDHVDMVGLAVPAPQAGCPAAIGVFSLLGGNPLVLGLAGELDINIPNTNGIVLTLEGAAGPLKLSITGRDNAPRFVDYSLDSCLSGVDVLAAPGATVHASSDAGSCTLEPTGDPIKRQELLDFVLEWATFPSS
jgi:hypothetical protein